MITESNGATATSVRNERRKPMSLRQYQIMIGYRFLLAIFGGYLLSALVAVVAALAFPAGYQASATLAGMLLSFAIYTGVFIWVFIVHSIRKATLGVLIPVAIFAVTYWFLKN